MCSEKDYSHFEIIQGSYQIFQEEMSHQIHPKIRPCNTKRNHKRPKATSEALRGSVSMLKVRTRVDKCVLFGTVIKRKPLLLHLNKPHIFWTNVLWMEMEMFGYVWCKSNPIYQHKHLRPTVKHSGGATFLKGLSADYYIA